MKRLIDSEEDNEDIQLESSIRPSSISEYIGQSEVKENIKVFIEAALIRNEPLDHVFYMSAWSWKNNTCYDYCQ